MYCVVSVCIVLYIPSWLFFSLFKNLFLPSNSMMMPFLLLLLLLQSLHRQLSLPRIFFPSVFEWFPFILCRFSWNPTSSEIFYSNVCIIATLLCSLWLSTLLFCLQSSQIRSDQISRSVVSYSKQSGLTKPYVSLCTCAHMYVCVWTCTHACTVMRVSISSIKL